MTKNKLPQTSMGVNHQVEVPKHCASCRPSEGPCICTCSYVCTQPCGAIARAAANTRLHGTRMQLLGPLWGYFFPRALSNRN